MAPITEKRNHINPTKCLGSVAFYERVGVGRGPFFR